MARRKISRRVRIRRRRIEALKMLGTALIFILAVFLIFDRNPGPARADTIDAQASADGREEDSESTEAEAVQVSSSTPEYTLPEMDSMSPDGWQSDDKGWFYVDKDGNQLKSQWATIDGRIYYFGDDGYMATGWITIDGRLYHLTLAGELETDTWATDTQGNAYHLNSSGYADTGWITIDGGTYYLGTDGIRRTGKTEVDGTVYYFGSDGRMAVGWTNIGDTTYHFDENGQMSIGWFTDEDGSIYYFNEDGTMAHSWLEVDGKKYFPGQDGILDIGWTRIDGNQYYFLEDGSMATGQMEIEGKSYIFGDDGILASGLTKMDGKLFYFDENGAKKTGIVHLDSGTYFFGGYDGSAQYGWVTDDAGNRYYMDPETLTALTGWQTLNDETLYFTSEGIYDPNKKQSDIPMVALTFDDGPGYYTNRLLDILIANDAKASFFMIGEEVEKYKDETKRIYETGMDLGNHSWSHKNLRNLSGEEVKEELDKTANLVEEITGKRPWLWRPPGGAFNDTVLANDSGVPVILWSLDTLDWDTKNTESNVRAVLDNVQDGDIILMHEIYQTSVDAVEIFLPELTKRGFKVVSVTELAKAKGITLVEDYAYGRIEAQ